MLGMHGSVYANYAVDQADLLLAFGVRFDDRVTGKLEAFCRHGKIVHIDIDASEINKNKPAHIPIISDLKYALEELNKVVEPPEDAQEWIAQCKTWKRDEPFHYNTDGHQLVAQTVLNSLATDPFLADAIAQAPKTTSIAND